MPSSKWENLKKLVTRENLCILLFLIGVCVLISITQKDKTEIGQQVLQVDLDVWLKLQPEMRRDISLKRVCVCCYDDRVKTNLSIARLKKYNSEYCKIRDYDFVFLEQHILSDKYPPYWLKVKIVQELVESNQYDYVMWIDSDVAIYDRSICIEQLFEINPKVILIKSTDNDKWSSTFNAGVWIIKNCDQSKELLRDWMNLFPSDKWVSKIDRNKRNWFVVGPYKWADESFEQGSGANLFRSEKYQNTILTLHWKILQAYKADKSTFTLHFPSDFRPFMHEFINSLKHEK